MRWRWTLNVTHTRTHAITSPTYPLTPGVNMHYYDNLPLPNKPPSPSPSPPRRSGIVPEVNWRQIARMKRTLYASYTSKEPILIANTRLFPVPTTGGRWVRVQTLPRRRRQSGNDTDTGQKEAAIREGHRHWPEGMAIREGHRRKRQSLKHTGGSGNP